MENTYELELVIRGTLVSNPKITSAHRLEREYEEREGRCFPYRALGFSSFLDYLKSIPHVVRLQPLNSSNPDVLPVVGKFISHIDHMIGKQKTTEPKRKSRRGGFHGFGRGKAFPPRRRKCGNISPPKFIPTSNNKGVSVSDIESHMRGKYGDELLSNNGIHSAQDLLSHASEMVESVNQKVYPRLSHSSEITTATNRRPEYSECMSTPAGMEEEYDSYFEQYDDYYDDDIDTKNQEDAFFYKNEQETISKCTSDEIFYSKRNYQSAIKIDDEDEWISEDHESTLSKVMINNFRLILAKNPDGIWATDLQHKYQEEFKVPLNILDLGYVSAIMMVSHLPNVFTYERVGQDWKLFDARSQDKQVKVKSKADDNTGGCEKYIPESLCWNVIKLVEHNPDGIKSTQFLSFYERKYHKKLDVEELGFKRLEDFLELFKDKITLTKSVGHYLLLPKHTTRRLEKPPSPEVALKLPDSTEFLGPENVLRPNDVIPLQELPEVDVSKDHSKPLIEMEVRVAEVITPSYFFIMLDSQYNSLESMMEDLEKFYNQEESNYRILLPYLTENLFCACKYENLWHRAKINSVLPNNIVDIEYIDYGTPAKVKSSELRFLHSDFAKLPVQAICAKLIGINPVGGGTKWPTEACKKLLHIVSDKRLLAYVYQISSRQSRKDRTQVEMILYDTNELKEIIVNEYLVHNGLAEFTNIKSDTTLEEKSHTLNQSSSTESTSTENPPPTQTMEPKRTPRVPPGFENFTSSDSQDGQHIFNPVLYHEINSVFGNSGNSHFEGFQSYSLQHPAIYNMQNMPIINPNFNNWPQFPCIPQVNPNFISTPTISELGFPPPSLFFAPPNPPHTYAGIPPYVNTHTTQHQHSQPLNLNVNIQMLQSYNRCVNNSVGKIPGYSVDLSVPPPAPPSHPLASPAPPSRPLSSQKDIGSQKNTSDQHSKIANPIGSDLMNQINTLPMAPSNKLSAPKPLTAMLRHECNVLDLTELSDEDSNFELDISNGKISNDKSLKCQFSSSPTLTSSDKFASAEDITECLNVERNEEMTQLNEEVELSLVNKVNEITNDIPETWEDIDPDDTPAKAVNFPEDFKDLEDLTLNDKSYIEPNEESSNTLILEANKVNSHNKFFNTKSIENTTNWKDIFNPDNTRNTESDTKHKITPHIEGNNLKERLVEKIEFENNVFHIVLVESRYAVLAKEFYTQFVSIKFTLIEKLVEIRYKRFKKIYRDDYKELFSELEKITPNSDIVKKNELISYVSEIPTVFSVLQYKPDQKLLDTFKVWEGVKPNRQLY